ncbi:hypothetical protein [Actinacidiphila soli]|jgi:hypothetical protein|uniref:hypothetical protein n=1 Tax=Actinacidiphila soli TaxID=2487275 RepID=UPI001F0C6A4D|nr:hypothetical protein [Actinacidiphila soli]
MLLWTTIRMVWLSKAGPPVVMLGDQALTRVPLPWDEGAAVLAAFAVLSGTTARVMPANAPATDSKALRRGRQIAVRPLLWDIMDLSTFLVVAAGVCGFATSG